MYEKKGLQYTWRLRVMNIVLFAQNPYSPFNRNIINSLCVCDGYREPFVSQQRGLNCPLPLSKVCVVDLGLNSHVSGHRAWFRKGHATSTRALGRNTLFTLGLVKSKNIILGLLTFIIPPSCPSPFQGMKRNRVLEMPFAHLYLAMLQARSPSPQFGCVNQ